MLLCEDSSPDVNLPVSRDLTITPGAAKITRGSTNPSIPANTIHKNSQQRFGAKKPNNEIARIRKNNSLNKRKSQTRNSAGSAT